MLKMTHQSILVFLQIRRSTPAFPLRPFLPPLVTTLQDSDGTVRDCARKSVIAIFSSPGVAEAAKADLKREMEKQGVRKAVVEEILGGVIGGAQSHTQAQEVPEAKVPLPPSRVPTTNDLKTAFSRAATPDISDPSAPPPQSSGGVPVVYVSAMSLSSSPDA